MATADYLSSADLKGVARDGVIREDVMDSIFDISRIPLPFTDMVGKGAHSNSYTSWVMNTLQAPNTANAAVDGQDMTTFNNVVPTARVGNQSQISVKHVAVSARAQASANIGGNALAWQVMTRQQELRRDVEAIALFNQASLADNGDSVAGKSGGLPSWINTSGNYSIGATGTIGGYSTSTGLTVAYIPGTGAAGSETTLRNLLQGVYTQGGNPTVLMSTPSVIRGLSGYMFTSTARVATLFSDVKQQKGGMVASGSVNVFSTDFGVTCEMVPNRLQPSPSATQHTLFILDPQYLELSYLKGYTVDPLAKAGLADKRMMSVDWTLKPLSVPAQGMYADIDPSLAWVA